MFSEGVYMKKGLSIFLKIVSILMIIGGVECLIFSATYQESPKKVEHASDIIVSDITDYSIVYIEELNVLERYAFKTKDEYKDSEGTYTEVNFYVYDASSPMDNNELFAEYYIVKFRDKTGQEQIASLSVSSDEEIATSLSKCPTTISACIGVSPVSNSKLLNSYDKELKQIREQSLLEYSTTSELPQISNITFGYQNESIEQYQKEFESDVKSAKIIALVFGIVLIVGGTALFIHVRKKQSKSK